MKYHHFKIMWNFDTDLGGGYKIVKWGFYKDDFSDCNIKGMNIVYSLYIWPIIIRWQK